MKTWSILVVDDERRYRDLLDLNLARQGYRVIQAADGLSALNQVELEAPDLVVLDLKLPDIDGYEVCRRIREYSNVPIIMLTAKAEPQEKVRGLTTGADDYITKPFSADELIARVAAVLRRTDAHGEAMPASFRSGALEIDFRQHKVTVAERDIPVTPGEYRLLALLASNAGRVIVQEEILRRVWGEGYSTETALLQTAVRRLRTKIEVDPALPRYVLTKRGVGYWLAKD